MPQPVGIAPKSAMNSPLEYDFFELMRTLTGYLVSLSDRSFSDGSLRVSVPSFSYSAGVVDFDSGSVARGCRETF